MAHLTGLGHDSVYVNKIETNQGRAIQDYATHRQAGFAKHTRNSYVILAEVKLSALCAGYVLSIPNLCLPIHPDSLAVREVVPGPC